MVPSIVPGVRPFWRIVSELCPGKGFSELEKFHASSSVLVGQKSESLRHRSIGLRSF
jgi:hypothetical protein